MPPTATSDTWICSHPLKKQLLFCAPLTACPALLYVLLLQEGRRLSALPHGQGRRFFGGAGFAQSCVDWNRVASSHEPCDSHIKPASFIA